MASVQNQVVCTVCLMLEGRKCANEAVWRIFPSSSQNTAELASFLANHLHLQGRESPKGYKRKLLGSFFTVLLLSIHLETHKIQFSSYVLGKARVSLCSSLISNGPNFLPIYSSYINLIYFLLNLQWLSLLQ